MDYMIGLRVPNTHSKERLFVDDGLSGDLKSDRIGRSHSDCARERAERGQVCCIVTDERGD